MGQLMESFYTQALTINLAYWAEAEMDTRYECGDQNLWNDLYGNLPAMRRHTWNFNQIRPIINMISGYQRKNRKSTIVVPVENGDEETADQYTKVLMWLNNQSQISETVSDTFQSALITGMSLLQVWVDYRSDPVSGNIRVDKCDYNSFLIDPYFRKPDLSDCNGIMKRSWMTKAQCISMIPEKEDIIMGVSTNNNRDGKFQFMPESYSYGMVDLVPYDEYYYRSFRKQKMIVDVRSGESLEWKSGNMDGLKEFMGMHPELTLVDQEIPTVRCAIRIGQEVVYDGPNPLGVDSYPFVPVFAYYNPHLSYYPWRVTSVVRGLRDPQYLYNRFLINIADILESQVNSGWVYKENALVNPADVFMSGNGKGLALKEEAQMTDVQKIPAGEASSSMFNMVEIFNGLMPKISNVNEELLGSAVDDKAGILSMLRQGAGLTGLQPLFDRLDQSQKLLGKLLLSIIQRNFMPGKIKRILEEEPTAQFYNRAFGEYDCAVEEGLNTTTQKQMQFAQMLQMREAGVPITNEDLLEASTFQGKKKIVENMAKQQQQQQQIEQQQMQSAMAEQEARTQLAHARAVADQGLGLERASRVQENEALAVERKAQAEKEQTEAVLNAVKTMKEIDSIDIEDIKKLIELSQLIKREQQVEEADIQQKSSIDVLHALQANQRSQQVQQPNQEPQQSPIVGAS